MCPFEGLIICPSTIGSCGFGMDTMHLKKAVGEGQLQKECVFDSKYPLPNFLKEAI